MNVVIDTNIYRQDLAARSARFDILLDYVRKTGSRIVVPKLVHDELAAHLARELRDRESKVQAAHRDLSRLLPHRPALEPPSQLDIDKEITAYMQYLLRRLEVEATQIVPYQDAHLQDVMGRAIQRRKPCSSDGEEIRDAVLWVTVLDLAEKDAERSIVFVSHNKKQFADSNDLLHPDLAAECSQRGVGVKYFHSLEEFAKQHAQQVGFATPEWLEKNIDSDEIFDKAWEGIQRIAERRVERKLDSDEELSDDVELLSGGVSDPDLYVYEMLDGSFRVEATYSGFAEVSFSIYKWTYADPDWDYLTRYLASGSGAGAP